MHAEPISFSIQNENIYASGKIKRLRGPRPSLTLFRPHFNLISGAKAYFLNYYMCGLTDSPAYSACMSECLVAWHSFKQKSTMADLAVSSVALAIYSQTQNNLLAAKLACKGYCRLLHVAQQQIIERGNELDEEGIDECLLTIILMALYETTMHQPHISDPDLTLSQHSWSHHIGAMAVLRMWYESFGDNAPSLIVRQARQGLIRSALLRLSKLPHWIQNGSRFHEQVLDLNFDFILCQVVNMRHSLRSLEGNEIGPQSEADRLVTEASNIDQACITWASQLPSVQLFREHDILEYDKTSFPERIVYSRILYSFERPAYAAAWLQYLAIHIIVVSTRLSLLKDRSSRSVNPGKEWEKQQLSLRLMVLTNYFSFTVPFSLGRFEIAGSDASSPVDKRRHTILFKEDHSIKPALALPAVLPLVIVSCIEGINQELQLWFQAQLMDLANALGDGALKSVAKHPPAHSI